MKLSFSIHLGVLLLALSTLRLSHGLRFVIDREECFSHNVEYEWDTVHVSYVVIKSDAPWRTDVGVDIVVKGPEGDQIQDNRDKISDKFEFVAHKKGPYRFCFINKSPYHETIDFDVQVGHFTYYEQHAKDEHVKPLTEQVQKLAVALYNKFKKQHAKDEHVKPLMEQVQKLADALYNIQFEQHWLEAETDRQAIVNEAMSKRAIQKVVFESVAVVAASVMQVYLLRRLFERKIATTRV